MTWLPLFGTVLGAVIALGSTLLVEGRRERREDRIERRKTRQEVYSRYLAAHAEARTQLRVLSLSPDLTDEDRGHRAFTAYAACYTSRYELAVLAPQSVLTPAKAFERRAKDLRDLVIASTYVHTREERMRDYLDAMALLQMAMRNDLEVDEISLLPPD
jgi:hypothetical protein